MADEEQKTDRLLQPLTREERLAIRSQLRERNWKVEAADYANGKEGQKLFAQHHHAVRLAALNTAADHGKAFVKTMVLLNGGAIVALLALIGGLYAKTDAFSPRVVAAFTGKLQLGVSFFLWGLVCAASIAGIAFFQWFAFAETYFNEAQTANAVSHNDHFGGQDKKKVLAQFDRSDWWSEKLVWVCTALGAASIVLFSAGAIKISKAFAFFGLLR